jgi:hypothetical protein
VPLFASHEQFERRNRSTFNDIEKSIIELNFFSESLCEWALVFSSIPNSFVEFVVLSNS